MKVFFYVGEVAICKLIYTNQYSTPSKSAQLGSMYFIDFSDPVRTNPIMLCYAKLARELITLRTVFVCVWVE